MGRRYESSRNFPEARDRESEGNALTAGGYIGRILSIDLTHNRVAEEEIADDVLRKYIGGSGLAARLIWDKSSPMVEPLSPDNVLVFATGPLTGTGVLTSGRHAVAAKSPLTGIWGEADCGGNWGQMLKRAGYDAIVISGRAESPVYISIIEGKVEIRPAASLWGLDTYVTDELIKGEVGPGAVVACIGPAGERLSLLASVMADGKEGRAAGRCGLGAVMGSKNLKAIAVFGTRRPVVARPLELRDSIKRVASILRNEGRTLHEFGTARGVTGAEAIGDLPIGNWRKGSWREGAEKISGPTMAKTILSGRFYCASCVIGCGRRVRVSDCPYGTVEGAGPEYETLASLGSLCLVDDLRAIAAANEICNRFGMDTISVGAAVAFAMEAYERGILADSDFDGAPPRWGDGWSMVSLVEKIGKRQGIGELLSQGVRKACQSIGGLALELDITTKGLELPMHDPRALASLAVAYATSNRGACHVQAVSHAFEGRIAAPEIGIYSPMDRFETKNKGWLTKVSQDLMGLFDSLKLCKLALLSGLRVADMVSWTRFVTGWDVDVDEMMLSGERMFNLKRLYNVGCGISRKDDRLPDRILTLRRGDGGAADFLPPLESMLAEYYAVRGWDEFGIPTDETLKRLGLEREGEEIVGGIAGRKRLARRESCS